jgi:branched-chain amino acid transport system ATP-binding protein
MALPASEGAGVADPILQVTGLRKRYGALQVTDGVDLAVAPGRIHAVIGPNGAGKTTLIQQIFGAVRPDAGQISLAGHDITRLAPHRRVRLGLTRSFQITSVLPEFSVLENVALAVQGTHGSTFRFVRAVRNDTRLNTRAEAALAQVGLAARTNDVAGSLSHGEKRQLELAMALAAEPKVMLLDEPLAGAGPEEAARLIDLLRMLRGQCAILLVEHDMDAVFQLADVISVLAQGRVIASGPPDAIRADPAVRSAYLGEDF